MYAARLAVCVGPAALLHCMHPSSIGPCCNRASSSSVVSDPSLPLSLGVYCMVSNPGHCNRRDRIIEQTVVTDQRLARAHGGNDVRTCTDPIRSEASSSTDHMRATRCTAYMHVTLSTQLPSIPRCPKFSNARHKPDSIIHMGSSPEWADPSSISVAIRRRHLRYT